MKTVTYEDKKFKLSHTADEINTCVKQMAGKINADFKDKNPLFIVVLNGAFVFAADLLRQINIKCEVSFVKLSSYEGMHSTGKVKEVIGMRADIKGRTVVVIEDIVDSGNTIQQILWDLQEHLPKEIAIAALFIKKDNYSKSFSIDYTGFEISREFIVGYGLDYKNLGRNLPDVYKHA